MPGVSTFYALPAATTACTDLRTFFEAIKAYFHTSLTITVPTNGDSIESTTGALTGGWSRTSGAPTAGSSSADWAAGVGCRVQWNTTGILRGRRVKGATFLAPMQVGLFDSNGTLKSAAFTVINGAAGTLAATTSLIVWSRPSTPGGSDGAYSTITTATLPDRVTSLRSRRY